MPDVGRKRKTQDRAASCDLTIAKVRLMRRWTTRLMMVLALVPPAARAQTQDSRGREFVLGFLHNNIGTPNLRLFVTGDAATTGTIQIPGIGFSQSFSVTPGSITSVIIPPGAQVTGSDTVTNQGVLVSAGQEVAVYGLSQIPLTTDAFLGLPTDVLYTDHLVMSYPGIGANSPSEFLIVGTTNGTQVTITPKGAVSGRVTGVPYTITLDRLQTYQLKAVGTSDLTGTRIQSTGPVALFGGTQCTNVPPGSSFCDHLVEQIPPTRAWGQSFLTVPLATRRAGDVFRVLARDTGTQVRVNGSLVSTLAAGAVYETTLSSGSYNVVETSGPALLMQFSTGTSTDGVPSDPFMMMIPPTEQFQRSYTLTTPAASPVVFTNYINVAAKAGDTSGCRLDGAAIAVPFVPIGTSGFSGAQIPVAIGTHTVSCSHGFGAYAYGFARDDSYGYPAGLALLPIATPRCDVNRDGRVDNRDINAILAARNTRASGPEDPRDADADLTITVADARACTVRCTNPGCAR